MTRIADKVPVEYVGQARQLFRKVRAASLAFRDAADHIYSPLQHRFRLHQKVRHETLAGALRDWRHNVPSQFRLGDLQHELHGFCLDIGEIRLLSGELRDHAWAVDAKEPSLSVELVTLCINKRECSLTGETLAVFSLHALARRYERCRHTSTGDVLRDITRVVKQHKTLLKYQNFEVQCIAGHWRGQVATAHSPGEVTRKVLTVRTYVDDDAVETAA